MMTIKNINKIWKIKMTNAQTHEISISNTSFYLKTDEDGGFDSAVAYAVIENLIFGAFYGYAGGGDYDGGFFKLDTDTDEFSIRDYEQAEEDEFSNIYTDLMQLCGQVFNADDSSELTEDGVALNELGDDHESGGRVSLLNNFDGDLLAGISENWNISLKFLY
jgi:hypothetical protein